MDSEDSKAVVVRSNPAPQKDYGKYREDLRIDFFYSCAYCSIMEFEAGGIGFEIDHYLPQEKFPQLFNDYQNLMYSCEKCNGLKGDFHADDALKKAGKYPLRADEEDPDDHFESKGELLCHKTETGEFNIMLFDLNRKGLRRARDLRSRYHGAFNDIMLGINQLASIKIERADRNKRPIFAHFKKEMSTKAKVLTLELDQLLKEFARSPLLDIDPDKKNRIKKRAAYLKKQKAIVPTLK